MRSVRLLLLFAGIALAVGATAQAQDWSTIKGQVVFKNGPKPEAITPTNDKAHCESKGPLLSTLYSVNEKNGGFRNIVVWLRVDDAKNHKAPFPIEKIKPDLVKVAPVERVIDQPCCQFEPRILAVRAGDTLIVKNSAPVGHNIKFNGDGDLSFNTNLPPAGVYKIKNGLVAEYGAISFECNVHPWMKGQGNRT